MIFYALMPCRHPLSFRKERGERSVRGEPPEPPGDFVDFLSMKINSNAATRTGPYNEGARGPRGPVGRGTEKAQRPQSPGPQPLFLSLVFMISRGRFSSKENRQDHLGSGGIPQRRFCFLLSPRTKGSGRALDSFLSELRSLCADKP